MAAPLEGKVALVAGATRGAGRGIATQLGAAGATVYVTGRTTRQQRSEMDRPETIEETAERVTGAGGRGIAVPVDHLVPERGAGAGGAHRARRRAPGSAGERHLRRDADRVEQVGLGIGPRLRAAHAAPGGRHACDHQPLRDPAADPPAGRAGGRDRRRHRRLQRQPLPQFVLLRPGQGGGAAHGVRARPRAEAAWRDRGVADAGLAAFRGDARGLRRERSELARRADARAAFRDRRIARLRRPRRRRAGARSGGGALERPVAVERARWQSGRGRVPRLGAKDDSSPAAGYP